MPLFPVSEERDEEDILNITLEISDLDAQIMELEKKKKELEFRRTSCLTMRKNSTTKL